MTRLSGWPIAAVVLALGVTVACAPQEKAVEPVPPEPAPNTAGGTAPAAAPEPAPASPAPVVAHAAIQSSSGVGGTVTFTEQGGTVNVEARLTGVGAGEHGFHVHEKGDCSAPDFTSAGGHFNPSGAPHGAPADAAHHAGDFGNITIAADGTGSLTLSSSMITVGAGPNSVVGKAVIVHEKADDLKTQPTGDAGGRIGCGVVEAGAAPAPAAS